MLVSLDTAMSLRVGRRKFSTQQHLLRGLLSNTS
jgi:hypothetical protein